MNYYDTLKARFVDGSDDLHIYPNDSLYEVLHPMFSANPEAIHIYRNRTRILHGDKKKNHEVYSILPHESQKKFAGDPCSKSAIQMDCHHYAKKVNDKEVKGKKEGDKVKLDLPPEAL
jgi:hypothetical protein